MVPENSRSEGDGGAHKDGLYSAREHQGRVRTGAESGPAARLSERDVHRDVFRAGSAEQFAGADRVPTPFILSSINGAI